MGFAVDLSEILLIFQTFPIDQQWRLLLWGFAQGRQLALKLKMIMFAFVSLFRTVIHAPLLLPSQGYDNSFSNFPLFPPHTNSISVLSICSIIHQFVRGEIRNAQLHPLARTERMCVYVMIEVTCTIVRYWCDLKEEKKGPTERFIRSNFERACFCPNRF